jgi:hypothetical protein
MQHTEFEDFVKVAKFQTIIPQNQNFASIIKNFFLYQSILL